MAHILSNHWLCAVNASEQVICSHQRFYSDSKVWTHTPSCPVHARRCAQTHTSMSSSSSFFLRRMLDSSSLSSRDRSSGTKNTRGRNAPHLHILICTRFTKTDHTMWGKESSQMLQTREEAWIESAPARFEEVHTKDAKSTRRFILFIA